MSNNIFKLLINNCNSIIKVHKLIIYNNIILIIANLLLLIKINCDIKFIKLVWK